jgi:carbon storage regulator
MLVLSRYVGEKIKIGNNIYIEVTEIRCDRVRLGIVAPIEIPVIRTELLEYEDKLPQVHYNGDEPLKH